MLKSSLWFRLAAFLLALSLSACGGSGGSSAPPPTGFQVTPGNGTITVTWNATPGVDYWLMYAQTATPIDIKNPPSPHTWVQSATSPFVLSGLTNGTVYSFAMNARTNGGPGGAQTASLSAAGRYAGGSWTAGATTVTAPTDLFALAYGTASDASVNYLAFGSSGKIFKTTDGATWSAVTPSAAIGTDFKGAVYAFGKFIGVGSNAAQGSNNILVSTNLSDWTGAASGTITAGINAVATNGSLAVAVGDAGTTYYSTDGSNWTAAAATNTVATLKGVAYSSSNGLWVAVGQNGALITSTDGSNWTARTSQAGSTALNSVAVTSGNGFVAVGNGGTVVTSSDGQTWTLRSVGSLAPNLYAVSTDSNQFLAVGQGGNAYTSPDGITWTSIALGATYTLYAIQGGVSSYVVVGAAGANLTSR